MKRLWVSIILLAVLFIGSLLNNLYMKHFCEEVNGYLIEGETYVQDGNWDMAKRNITSALSEWENHEPYLHILFLHEEIDDILTEFHALMALANEQETGMEYSTANARLMTQIGLLYEMDQLNWENIF